MQQKKQHSCLKCGVEIPAPRARNQLLLCVEHRKERKLEQQKRAWRRNNIVVTEDIGWCAPQFDWIAPRYLNFFMEIMANVGKTHNKRTTT